MLGVKPSRLEKQNETYNAVVLRVNNRNVKALLDSGASRNCISERYLKQIRMLNTKLNTDDIVSLVSASGTNLQSLGTVMLDVSIQGLSIPTVFHVLRGLNISCILGVNFLQDSHAIMDCARKSISLFDGLVEAPLINNFDKDTILLLAKTVTLPPRSESFIPVRVHNKFLNQTLLVEGWPSLKNQMVAVAALQRSLSLT